MERSLSDRLKNVLTRRDGLEIYEANLGSKIESQGRALQDAEDAIREGSDGMDVQLSLREAALSLGQLVSDESWIRAMKETGLTAREILLIAAEKNRAELAGMGQLRTSVSQELPREE